MLKVIHCDIDEFKHNIAGKKLFVFGAGEKARLFYREWNLKDVTEAIVDNNKFLQGKSWQHDSDKTVVSTETMINWISHDEKPEQYVLVITSSFYSAQIIEDLDQIRELDGIETYVGALIAEYIKPMKFEMTIGSRIIPKVMHYCWFGGKKIPKQLEEYMQTWREMCPDYQIIRWDESNYDITQNQYMYEAYQAKKWGFVPDYARLDIIYRNGGIYLDTDIKLLKNFDDLLSDKSFFSVDYEGSINLGSGFGAVKGNPLIKKLMDVYEDMHFINSDGSCNMRPCQHYQNPVFRRFGFTTENRYQKVEGNVLYPSQVLAPIGTYTGFTNFTDKTHSIHFGALSWRSEAERKGKEDFKRMCRERFVSDSN